MRSRINPVWSAALVVAAVGGSAGAASLTYSDGVCQYRVRFDAKAIDERQLQASFDYLAAAESTIDFSPALTTSAEIAAIDLPAYRNRCAAHRARLAAPALIAFPGLDDLRRRDLADLDATCARTEAALAAAKGDLAQARAFAPACLRYADILALTEPELKGRFNDLVMDLCQASTNQHLCAGELQRRGEGPGSTARRRLAVLDRWIECATSADRVDDTEKPKLLEALAKHYRAKATSCARLPFGTIDPG